jgi:gamma-glutamylcyclotransferase (GGCT)/AIG2-like uncharacterized protein YtfP
VAVLPLFVYGTLLDEAFTANLLEHPVSSEAARLLDFEILTLEGFPYAMAFFAPGDVVAGRLYRDLTEEDYARLDAYEGVDEGFYQRIEAAVVAGTTPLTACLYVPTEKTLRQFGAL